MPIELEGQTTMSEQEIELFENASQRLRDAAQALSNINGLVPNIVQADWNYKNPRKLPLKYTQWLLNHIASNLEGRISTLRGDANNGK
jgi:hypothetical protein